MVYAASSLALAALETLAHLPPAMRRGAALPPMIALELDVPDDTIQPLDPSAPDAPSETTRNLGDHWLAHRTSLGLLVPSRIVPVELNLLLNPLHSMAATVTVSRQFPFRFDDRLF